MNTDLQWVMMCEYLRLSRTFAVKEVTHNSAVSVAGEEAFTRNTDTEETKNTEEENSRLTFEQVQPANRCSSSMSRW